MKHIINSQEINIDWQIGNTIDEQKQGCNEVEIEGLGSDGLAYYSWGVTHDSQLIEVYEKDIYEFKT